VPASDDLLGQLHELTTLTMLQMARPREEIVMTKEGPLLDDAVQPVMRTVYPTAAELSAAIAFLKNNNITCVASDDNAMGELKKLMETKRNKRKLVMPDTLDSMPEGMH
jgi:hypothetical protein